MKSLFLFLIAGVVVFDSFGQYVQVGSKLVGTGGVFTTTTGMGQGRSVSLSADGKTMAVGGIIDNSFIGAVWVYTFTGGNWVQVGNKLVGSNYIASSNQGSAVSLSSDGKTLAFGGAYDNSDIGAAWVFTFSGGNWSQVGNKIVGSGSVGYPDQGFSISLSSDGKTLAVGGNEDNSQKGATWIYTITGNSWSQVGNKLVGTGAIGNANQGSSVDFSGDGKFLAIGGSNDNTSAGAVWIYTFSGSNWFQFGNKLVGTGASGSAYFGRSVSFSDNGQTLAIGGGLDNSNIGATWVFTFTGSNWTQVGNKLVGSGVSGTNSYQGYSVSISGDGNLIAVGGPGDNSNSGATWIFTCIGGNWSQLENKLVGSSAINGTGGAYQGYSLSLSQDGTTIAMGGYGDNSYKGAVWVFNYSAIPTETANPQLITESANIYPNPFTHSITLSSETEVPYTLYNLQGIQVETGISSSPTIGIQLPPGVYQLKMNGNVSKVVKTP